MPKLKGGPNEFAERIHWSQSEEPSSSLLNKLGQAGIKLYLVIVPNSSQTNKGALSEPVIDNVQMKMELVFVADPPEGAYGVNCGVKYLLIHCCLFSECHSSPANQFSIVCCYSAKSSVMRGWVIVPRERLAIVDLRSSHRPSSAQYP